MTDEPVVPDPDAEPDRPALPAALGRRAPSNKRALRLADFLIPAGVPVHPIAVDDFGQIPYALDNNDRYGVCGPTAFDNLQRCVTGLLAGAPRALTWDQILEIYRWQNPSFDPGGDPVPGDGGVDLQTMFEQLLANGYIVGFARVNVDDEEEIRAATYLFLGLVLGVNLQQAQREQTEAGEWDYVPGSRPWGGHAVFQGAYDSDGSDSVISWQLRIRMLQEFLVRQREEAWVVLFQEHLNHPAFRAGFDAEKFAAAFTELTDQPFPGGGLPAPEPDPDPDQPPPYPGPAAAADVVFADELRPWLEHRHTGMNGHLALAAGIWLESKGL